MARFMNEYDINLALSRCTRLSQPNRLAAALVLDHLRDWADYNSDGWAYWAKPRQAAAKLIDLLYQEHDTDASDEELRAALRPVKAFLTRQKVKPTEREIILRAAEDVL